MFKKILSLLLIICLLNTLSGCKLSDSVVPDEEIELEDFVLAKVNDPNSNVIVLAGTDNGEGVMVLGNKDNDGGVQKITGVFYATENGDSFLIELGENGLPLSLVDSNGTKVLYRNYTESSVEISIYDINDNLINDPTTVDINSVKVNEIKQLYQSISSKDKGSEEIAEIFKIGGLVITVFAGTVVIIFGSVPAAIIAAVSLVVTFIAAITEDIADEAVAISYGVITCSTPFGCFGTLLSGIGMAFEMQEENINPFLGYWVNEDPNTDAITKVDIQKNNNLLEIYMWGKCHPTDCDWANMTGGPATTTVDDADDGVLNIVWYFDFCIDTQEITYLGGDRLEVYSFTDYYPDDIYNREDYESYNYFIKSN